MRSFYGILLGSFLITAACDDDPTEPRLHASATADQSSYALGDTIRLTLTNTSADEDLIVPACEYGEMPLLRVDRRTDGEWGTFHSSGCLGPSVIGITLEPGASLVRDLVVDALHWEPGTYRIGFYAHTRGTETFEEIDPTFTGSITLE